MKMDVENAAFLIRLRLRSVCVSVLKRDVPETCVLRRRRRAQMEAPKEVAI